MKKLFVLGLFLICAALSFAQTSDGEQELNPVTGFPVIPEKPFVVLNEGITFKQVTRLETNEGKSNYLWQNYMLGAFLEMQSVNMSPVCGIIRVAAYYPYKNYFNQIEQTSKQIILYAFDLVAGPLFETTMWDYVGIKYSPGLHFMYQLCDEYHLMYFGMANKVGIELPVAKHWTILVDGIINIDYPNLGSNRIVQPYDAEWQLEICLGVRYSIAKENKYSYIK